jgi:hypothetical protein
MWIPLRSLDSMFLMGRFWNRQTDKDIMENRCGSYLNATKLIIAANDDYYGEVALAA